MFVRLMLRMFGDKMSESGKCSFDIPGHGEVDFSFLVVPIECDVEIPSSFPVFFDFIVLLKCLDEVVGVRLVGSPVVFPVSWCDFALAVSCFKQSLF